jgi:catechol 2,3-dioxygenase-like lactoylglutathione lyase family enzyme
MTPELRVGAMAPLFIVRDVPAALAFYRDQLGFTVTVQGPDASDIFFGIVQRGNAMLMMKDVDMDPVPNHTRDIGHGHAPWDAYVYVPDPDALATELTARGVVFRTSLRVNSDQLRGFEVSDPNGYVLFFGRPEP